jgi:WhiB family redox-sensing transcriptional regulator
MTNPYEFPDLSQGSCVGVDTELFFPEHSINQHSDQMKKVKQLCDECPVLQACLTYALHVDVDGLWAGTGINQRKSLRKELGIRAVSLQAQYTTDSMLSQSKSAISRRALRKREKESAA